MSDISSSTPIPKAVQSVSHGTDKATGISRDKQQTDTQTREEDGRDHKKTQQQEATQGRDPAVSISASAAHLHVGEELKQKVAQVDPEGRPIIETETATFALRPDAGLKAGDDVTLIVKDAGKQLAADLLLRNGTIIDPPIRLNLIVIALHSVEPTTPTQSSERLDVTQNYKPVSNFAGPKVSITEATETETLARLLARGGSLPSAQLSSTTEAAPQIDNIQNSTNLAALITAQQSSASAQPTQKSHPDQLIPTVPGQSASVNNHLIPQSTLTEITTPNITQNPVLGLGQPISAISLSGKPAVFQILDPSISKVSPAEVASVISVKPLTPQDAKSLPVAATALGNTSALAHVETNKGIYVIHQASANGLAGELVRISSTVDTSTIHVDKELPIYSARLHAAHAQSSQSVRVQLPSADTPTNPQNNNTTVTAVHIVRAFLTPNGPKSDVRLETSIGDLSLTLPNGVRPAAGAAVAILPQPQTVEQIAGQASSTLATSLPPVSISQWPSFEQAYDILQSAAPLGAEALQSMSARTAQGGPKLANSAMFLLSALGAGGKTNWLGKAAESALSQRNPQLLDLLKEDISRLFNIASDTSGEWRALLLPLDAKNQDMPMLAFLFSHGSQVDPDKYSQGQHPDDEQDEEKRFVLEVQFSVLGPVQLDGSIKGNRFDLIVRSQTQFSPSLTQDTSELFSQALSAGAFTGSLGFSVEDAFPVDVNAVLEKMSPEQ